MSVNLREYQINDMENVRKAFREGYRSVLLVAPTGSGKTTTASAIIRGAMQKGKRITFLAHRRELVSQCSKRLDQLEVPHGVVMRGHWRNRPHEKVQVCSIQTLLRREAHDTDLYFIDEAHRALGNSYLEILKRSKDAKLIGLTATPIRTDGRGLGHLFDHIVPSLTPADLTEMGFLVPARVYAPSKPDLTGVHRQAGDYNQKELAERADTVKLIGDIVEHWHRLANGLSTVCFATSIKHSEHIVARFKAAGVPAEHIDGNTPVRDREAVLTRVERGETLVVSNVGVWTEGVDVPCMTCAILARPTQSLALYLQMAGRVLRPFEGKSEAIILDHAGCTLEHGFVTDDREWSLDGEVRAGKKGNDSGPAVRICLECYMAFPAASRTCPDCGWEYVPPQVNLVEGDGQLQEINETYKIRNLSKNAQIAYCQKIAEFMQYKPGWVYMQMKRIRGGEDPEIPDRARMLYDLQASS